MSVSINQTLAQNQTGGLVRLAIGIVLALSVTLSLFWVMQYLIATADRSLNEDATTSVLDFVRIKRDETIQRRQLKPEKPPPPEAAPPRPPEQKIPDREKPLAPLHTT